MEEILSKMVVFMPGNKSLSVLDYLFFRLYDNEKNYIKSI